MIDGKGTPFPFCLYFKRFLKIFSAVKFRFKIYTYFNEVSKGLALKEKGTIMKKIFAMVFAVIIAATMSGCGLQSITLPFGGDDAHADHSWVVDDNGTTKGTIEAKWEDEHWKVVVTDYCEDEMLHFEANGKEGQYRQLSNSETWIMDEENFNLFIEVLEESDLTLKEM